MADKCEFCVEKCPQAERAHQSALCRMHATNEFIALLKKVESGKLVEVVHGRWIEINRYKDVEGWIECDYVCSACGEIAGEEHNYCPNCGAKMDGERRTDNEQTD